VYLERSRTANWNAREFDHYRFREFMNHLRLPRTKSPWRRFVPWVAPLVFDDFPEADAVRVRAMRTTIPAPHILKRDGGLRFRKEVRSRIVLRGPEGPPR
jgi:hypothetical protein